MYVYNIYIYIIYHGGKRKQRKHQPVTIRGVVLQERSRTGITTYVRTAVLTGMISTLENTQSYIHNYIHRTRIYHSSKAQQDRKVKKTY